MQSVPSDFTLSVVVPDRIENCRTYHEGKHIGWKDGFRTLRCILQYH